MVQIKPALSQVRAGFREVCRTLRNGALSRWVLSQSCFFESLRICKSLNSGHPIFGFCPKPRTLRQNRAGAVPAEAPGSQADHTSTQPSRLSRSIGEIMQHVPLFCVFTGKA